MWYCDEININSAIFEGGGTTELRKEIAGYLTTQRSLRPHQDDRFKTQMDEQKTAVE